MTDPTRPPAAPLAACGAILAALALVGLARGYEPERSEPGEGASPRRAAMQEPDAGSMGTGQAARLLDHRPMDLNAASAEDLELLPRIGPTLAARIVEDRSARGAFRSVDDLARVRGIGPRTLAGIRPLATVEPPEAGRDPPR